MTTVPADSVPIVFGGPSLPEMRTPGFDWRPPAVRGDFLRLGCKTVVYVDSFMWQRATLTHVEILALLERGGTLIGAASAGALRAVELRDFGAIGIGYVYAALLTGRIVDDGELLAAVDPDSLRPMTLPLVDVRHILALGRHLLHEGMLRKMLDVAAGIYFMERTRLRLAHEWERLNPGAVREISQILPRTLPSIKEIDSGLALEFALARISDRTAVPDPLERHLDDVLLFG